MEFIVKIHYLAGVNQKEFYKNEVFNIPIEGEYNAKIGTKEYDLLLKLADSIIYDTYDFFKEYIENECIDIIIDWEVLCLNKDGIDGYNNHIYKTKYEIVKSVLYELFKDSDKCSELMADFAIVYSQMFDVIKNLDEKTQINILTNCLLLILKSNINVLTVNDRNNKLYLKS